jgi:Uma2 family endonuclease
MTSAALEAPTLPVALPDHTQLPDEDPTAVHNTHEHPQSNLLTECLWTRFREANPDGNFCVAADVGIYFEYTDPILDGCRVPDWFYVPGVPPMLDGKLRRSYVLWKELLRPAIVIEYVSADGSEENDRTPRKGKFWIYERVIGAGYYAIFDPIKRTLQVFAQNGNGYHKVPPNEEGRFPIAGLNVELGIWDGIYRDIDLPWLRVWDAATGKLMPTDREDLEAARARAEAEKERAEAAEMGLEESQSTIVEQTLELEERGKRIVAAEKKTDAERRRADEQQKLVEEKQKQMDILTAKLRALGIDPDA